MRVILNFFQVRSNMAAGCYSDHILISKAYDMWLERRMEGTDAVYVRDHFLHRGTLTMIEGVYTLTHYT